MSPVGLILFCFLATSIAQDKPNIIFILADDLGFNDIGYNNPEVITPNINDLAANGVILDRNYVQPICTPSRTALLSGTYPYKIGLQGSPLGINEPTGIPLTKTLFPQHLQSQGYQTHLVGKWHVGFCKEEYLPQSRGFSSAFGYWGGGIDYYNKTELYSMEDLRDFHLNQDVFYDNKEYSMDLYNGRIQEIIANHDQKDPLFIYAAMQTPHLPLQVPQKYINMYPEDLEENRRSLLGMVTAMDEVIGDLVKSLKDSGMYDNSVIIFSSDNGAPGKGAGGGAGSNYPLSGYKASYYEGGVRVPAFVHSPSLVDNPGRIYKNMLHISDWYPTILQMANFEDDFENDDIDGIDQYEALFEGKPELAPRKMVVNEIDYASRTNHNESRGAFQIEEGWKYVIAATQGGPEALFNVLDDPSETMDLQDNFPQIFESMKVQFAELTKDLVERSMGQVDEISDGNGNLATGWC